MKSAKKRSTVRIKTDQLESAIAVLVVAQIPLHVAFQKQEKLITQANL